MPERDYSARRKAWRLSLFPSRYGTHWAIGWRVEDPKSRRTGEVHRVCSGSLDYSVGNDHPVDLIRDLERIVLELKRRYRPDRLPAEPPEPPRGGYGGDVPLPGMPPESYGMSHRLDRGLPY